MRTTLIILAIIAVILAAITAGCAKDSTQILNEPAKECERVKGTWEMFSNGCVDSCYKARSASPVICTQALTYGCDCGPGRCWNDSSCVPN
ncbi:hypothetical protein HYY72_00440 [Candidatus Woesearchaeota archaeon]|nr:hypothetical protein [Candidatus Woesearchaeota archaeon]